MEDNIKQHLGIIILMCIYFLVITYGIGEVLERLKDIQDRLPKIIYNIPDTIRVQNDTTFFKDSSIVIYK